MPLHSGRRLAAKGRSHRLFVRLAVISTVAAAAAAAPAVSVCAQPPQNDRAAAAFVLARGRVPTAAEIEAWSAAATSPFSELLARHRQQLSEAGTVRRAVTAKAGLDAFGTETDLERAGSQATAVTYVEQMRQHLRWLSDRPDDYARVVQRAYRAVLRRDAYAPELAYWAKRPVLSFALLAACIDDWARRNQPGLTVTSGPAAVNVNSAYLATVRLSPADAAGLRAAAGFARPRGSAAALDRHVVAPGAEEVASVGGVHFVAAGAPGLRGE
jgi:hypothetical protein